MSFHLITQVWQLKLTPTQQQVLMAMADYADDDGCNCFPSQPRLAWKTGLSESTIVRTIDKLIAMGILKVLRAATNKKPARYQLELDMGEMKSPYRSENEDFRDSTVLPQDDSRDGAVLPQDSLGCHSATSRDSTVKARDSTVLPDPIINQSYNQAGNGNGPFPETATEKSVAEKAPETTAAETDRQWGEQVQELGAHHKTMGDWLQGSELLLTDQIRDGLRVCQLLVVDARSVDWLKSQGQSAIIKRLRHIFGGPVALDIVAEFNEELRQLTTQKGVI